MPSFATFRLDLVSEQLWKGEKPVPLRRKPMSILRFLVENPARLVTYDELLEKVWSGATVSESAIRTHFHELRQVLGEGVIETVIGRGYRFAAPVADEPHDEATPAAAEGARVVVGRETELAGLRAAYRKAREGERQLWFVTGEPGMGKTTLVEAFCDELPADTLVMRGVCVEQFTTPEPYLPVIDMLHQTRHSRHGERVAATLVKAAPTVLAQIPQLIPATKTDEVMRRAATANEARMVREMIDALEMLAAQQPVVVVFEDLQWSDIATIDLLGMLGQRRETARVMVIATSRRAEANTVSHPLNRVMRHLVARGSAGSLALEPIDNNDIRQLLDRRFGGHELPAALGAIIDRMTGGTPLFVVSALDHLVERGMIAERDGRWQLTTTLDEIVAHRVDSVMQLIDLQLDRLPPDEQRVLEAASVVGFEFSTGACAAALDRSIEAIDDICDDLARRGAFLRRDGAEEWPEGTLQPRYGFIHGLVLQACQERVSAARRQRWHRLIAERVEAAYGDRAGDVSQALALHFEHAMVLSKAIRYYVITAERAAHRFASNDAQRLFTHALALLHRTPETPERDETELKILGGMSPSVLRTMERVAPESPQFERMFTLARRIDNGPRSYIALSSLSVRNTILAEYGRAAAVCDEMDAIARETELDRFVLYYGRCARGVHELWLGNPRRTIELFTEIVDQPTKVMFTMLGPADGRVSLLTYIANGSWAIGLGDRAIHEAQRAVRYAREHGDPYSIGLALLTLSRLHLLRGESPELVRRAAEELLALPGAFVWHPAATILERGSRCHTAPLDVAEADELIRRFHGPVTRYPMSTTLHSLSLIDALRVSGHAGKAREIVDEMLAFVAAHRERIVESELVRIRGELQEPVDRAAAAASYREAIAIARELQLDELERRAAVRLAALDG